jgi:hypothetical protein
MHVKMLKPKSYIVLPLIDGKLKGGEREDEDRTELRGHKDKTFLNMHAVDFRHQCCTLRSIAKPVGATLHSGTGDEGTEPWQAAQRLTQAADTAVSVGEAERHDPRRHQPVGSL